MVTEVIVSAPVTNWEQRTGKLRIAEVNNEHRLIISLGQSEIFSGTLDELNQVISVADAARKLQIVLSDE